MQADPPFEEPPAIGLSSNSIMNVKKFGLCLLPAAFAWCGAQADDVLTALPRLTSY